MSQVEETRAAKQQALTELSEASGIPISELESSADFHEAVYRVIRLLRAQLATQGQK